jgi:hypothetical protein
MEPRQMEEPEDTRGEGQPAPPHPPERKRRFQVIKLEERIAPFKGGWGQSGQHSRCGNNGCFCF